jgi:phage gp45-like
MMQVTHNDRVYWIGHMDHVPKGNDGAPFEFCGTTTPVVASKAVTRSIRNNTDQDIQVVTFNDKYRGAILQPGHQNDYLFSRPQGEFIIVTQDLEAKVDASTWDEIIDNNEGTLFGRLAAERGDGPS